MFALSEGEHQSRFHACSIDTPRRREKKPAGQAGKGFREEAL